MDRRRMLEGVMKDKLRGGRIAHGLVEYHSQLVASSPAGNGRRLAWVIAWRAALSEVACMDDAELNSHRRCENCSRQAHVAAVWLAAYAFCCAVNRIKWLAGGHAVPKDQEFTLESKDQGENFSHVVRADAGYVE